MQPMHTINSTEGYRRTYSAVVPVGQTTLPAMNLLFSEQELNPITFAVYYIGFYLSIGVSTIWRPMPNLRADCTKNMNNLLI